jgi:hypothetical protein
MATTRNFIEHPVGDKAVNRPRDVKALQRLLMAAGEIVKGGDDAKWGDSTASALESFQRRHAQQGLTPKRLVPNAPWRSLLRTRRGKSTIYSGQARRVGDARRVAGSRNA